jgi:hypothetical protein
MILCQNIANLFLGSRLQDKLCLRHVCSATLLKLHSQYYRILRLFIEVFTFGIISNHYRNPDYHYAEILD